MKIRFYALFLALALSSLLAAAGGWYLQERVLPEEHPLQGENWIITCLRYPEEAVKLKKEQLRETEPPTEPPTEATTEPIVEATTEPVTEPATEPPTEPETEPVTEPTAPQAIYGEDESYFDDALFIGDSRTDGLRLYCPLGEASYFCTTGMTIFDVFDVTAPNRDLVEQTLEQVLEERQFGKIYITLGLNELSEKDIILKAEFQAVINRLRKVQPDAKLILHAITPLSQEKSASKPYFAKERVEQVNALLEKIAGEYGLWFLDATPVFAGADGYLLDGMSFDGCHLYARNYSIWGQFLCENTV